MVGCRLTTALADWSLTAVEMLLLYTLTWLLAPCQLQTSSGAIGAGIFHPASDLVFMNGWFIVTLFRAAQLLVSESLCSSHFQRCQVNAMAGHAGCCSVHWESSHICVKVKMILYCVLFCIMNPFSFQSKEHTWQCIKLHDTVSIHLACNIILVLFKVRM